MSQCNNFFSASNLTQIFIFQVWICAVHFVQINRHTNMMTKITALFLILNITCTSTWQRLKRDSYNEFDLSMTVAEPINVHHFQFEQPLNHFNFSDPRKFNQLPKQKKWIALGCSYGGTLAALARLKYPSLIHGAIASSAPIIAKVDYYEYEQIVEEALKSYDSKCIESITLAFEELANFVDSPQNIKTITEMFYLDNNSVNNINIVKNHIINIIMDIINRAVLHNHVHHINIPLVCSIMIEHNGTKLEALAEIRKKDMGYNEDHVNMPPKKSQAQYSARDDNNRRAWLYQCCSEIGQFSSYTNTTYLSPVKHLLTPIEVAIKNACTPYFGPSFSVENLTENIIHANLQYGVLDFNACNTIFIHGSLDPWHKAGLYKKTNTSLYETIFIKGASHCADIYPPSDRDIPELKNARNKVFKTLKSWLENKPLHQP